MPYKDFQVNEVLTSNDVNTFLMKQAVMSFADSTARAAAIGTPIAGMVSFLTGSTAIEVYSGSTAIGWTELGAPASLGDIGDVTISSATTGQVLEWNGTAWVNGQVDAAGIASDAVTTAKILDANVTSAKLGTGAVLQVQSTTKTSTFSTASASYVAVTGFTVSITPRSTSSKILLIANFTMGNNAGGNFTRGAHVTFTGGNSGNYIGDASGSRTRVAAAVRGRDGAPFGNDMYPVTLSYLDSPNTTSAITYGLQMKSTGSSAVFGFGATATDAAEFGLAPASITAIEIAG
jgi:hypothetical protein